MFTRPSKADTDEDLLKLQEQFLASKTVSAAKVIRPGDKRKPPVTPKNPDSPSISSNNRDVVSLGDLPDTFSHTTTAPVPPVKRTRFKEQQRRPGDAQELEDDPEERLDKHDSHITKVLTDIVEREMGSMAPYYRPVVTAGGFPKVLHRGDIADELPGKKTGKKSIFAQHFEKNAQAFGFPTDYKPSTSATSPPTGGKPLRDTVVERSVAMDASRIISGTGLNPQKSETEVQSIHGENVARLSAMSEREILEEQKRLLESLDPSLIALLKKRKATTNPEETEGSMDHEESRSSEQTEADIQPESSTNKKEDIAEAMDISDLPVKPSKEIPHMDKLEPEKLEWLRDLPAPKPGDPKTGKPARFDFSGDIVAMDADLPTHLGLHHHGDEPERAGYTLEELFHLARSAHLQQRTLSINTLAKIINNAKHGKFTGCISAPLVPSLVEGGLVFILRWALDDSTENTMAASVNALHALLVTKEDEMGLDAVFTWYRGAETSCLSPVVHQESDKQEEGEEEHKPTDAEIVKQDIIKGLLNMSLLPRLRYILEVWRPSGAVVWQVLEILIRISRHSNQVAYEVTQCPRLMKVIFDEFLPWKVPEPWPDPVNTVYGMPSSRALKLIRVLCTASRNITASLVSTFPLTERIVIYISQDQQGAVHPELGEILLESFRTWRVCVIYGLAVVTYSEYYPVLMKKLQWMCGPREEMMSDTLTLSTTFLSFLESVIHTAANATLLTSQQRAEFVRGSEPETHEAPAAPNLSWNQVSGLFSPIKLCLQTAVVDFIDNYVEKKHCVSLLASCCSFIASWLSRACVMPGYDAVEMLQTLEELCDGCILPLLKSNAFSVALHHLRQTSVILSGEAPQQPERLPNLPDIGALVGEKATTCPALAQNATINLILSVSRLLLAMKIHKTIIEKIYIHLLAHEETLQYLRRICQAKRALTVNNHFAQFENYLQQNLLELARCKMTGFDVCVYHQVALYLLTHVHEGSEQAIHHLLSYIIFNRDFLRDLPEDEDPQVTLSENLRIDHTSPLTSATKSSITANQSELLKDAVTSLSSVRGTYLQSLGGHQPSLDQSWARNEDTVSSPETLLLGRCGQLLIPVDWVFLPIIEVYSQFGPGAGIGQESSVSPAVISRVTDTLRWVYIMEAYRPGLLDSVKISLKISRLLCVFLAGSDLFLNARIQSYLAAFLHIYCKPVHLDRIDFYQPIPGLASFYDMYTMLLEQYQAVSFGDSLFGSYILLPLQQKHNVLMRKSVWGEHNTILRSLLIPIRELPVPLERFLEPEESDIELIRLYYQALVSQLIAPRRCPVPYLIAIHHINRFIYTQQKRHNKLRHAIVKQILQTQSKDVSKHLLYYKNADVEKDLGMDFYEVLPPIRQKYLDSITL